MRGAGKYDDLATYVRTQAGAKAVLVIVLDGKFGSGFACQGENHDPATYAPEVLRKIADEIERDRGTPS